MAERSRTDWYHVIALAVAIAYAAERKGARGAVHESTEEWQAIVDDKLAELRYIADVHVAYEVERR